MLQEVYNIFSYLIGTPPTTFAFEYRDENRNTILIVINTEVFL
ncbi:C1 family peptidase [Tetragenococcus halophilus]